MRIINLTVVQDGNEDIVDAIFYVEKAIAENKVQTYSVTASMGEDNLNVEVYEPFEKEVRNGLIALKYQIV